LVALARPCASFAHQIGCSSEEAGLLLIGASIHDISKLSISEHILNKPARLQAFCEMAPEHFMD